MTADPTTLELVWIVWDVELGAHPVIRGIYTNEGRAMEMVGHFHIESRDILKRTGVSFFVESVALNHAFGHEDMKGMARVMQMRAARNNA